MSHKKLEVLLVEDDSESAELLVVASSMAKVNFHFNFAADGVEALDFLNRKDPYANAPKPDFIILDLNLPLMSGRDVLLEMRKDPLLRRIPVIILTTTSSYSELAGEFSLPADCCYTKPDHFQDYVSLATRLEELYLRGRLHLSVQLSQLPSASAN